MAYKTYVADIQGVEDILNGVILLGPFPSTGLAIGAKTLIFTAPGVTATFTGAAGAVVTPSQMVTDINTASAGLAKLRSIPLGPRYSNSLDGTTVVAMQTIVLQRDAGVTVANTGTANDDLGLGGAPVVSAGKVAIAKIAGFSQGSMPAHYALVIEL